MQPACVRISGSTANAPAVALTNYHHATKESRAR